MGDGVSKCPLPERIPRPNTEQLEKLREMGVDVEMGKGKGKYVPYSLPTGWRIEDDSLRMDLPQFQIVDDKNLVRVTISGSWKEIYDCILNLRIPSELEPFKRRTDKHIAKDVLDNPMESFALECAIDMDKEERNRQRIRKGLL